MGSEMCIRDRSEALGMAARKVSPAAEGIKDVEADDTNAETAPLGTMPHVPTLHHLATREPTSFHQTTIYYGLVRPNTPPWRKYGLLALVLELYFCSASSLLDLPTGSPLARAASIPIAHAALSATGEFVNGATGHSDHAVKPTRQTPACWTKSKQQKKEDLAMN